MTRWILVLLLALPCRGMPDLREDQARDLERRLIAPCCWRQPVADHLSPESDRIKAEIRLMLAQGLSREQILDHYVQQYGKAILAQPPYQGFNLLAYVLPPLFLVVLGLGLGRFLVKGRNRPDPAPLPTIDPDHPYAAQLARELRDLNA